MTREELYYSMTMKMLAEKAEKMGVKIDKKGSKQKAVEKMLAAEAAMEQELLKEAQKVVETPSTLSVPMPMEYGENGPQLIEKEEPEQLQEVQETAEPQKKERKARKTADRTVQVEFEKNLTDLIGKYEGISEKRWEKIKNLVSLYNSKGKPFADLRFGLKGIRLNVKEDMAKLLNKGYHLQKYYLPASVDIIPYDKGMEVITVLFDNVSNLA